MSKLLWEWVEYTEVTSEGGPITGRVRVAFVVGLGDIAMRKRDEHWRVYCESVHMADVSTNETNVSKAELVAERLVTATMTRKLLAIIAATALERTRTRYIYNVTRDEYTVAHNVLMQMLMNVHEAGKKAAKEGKKT